MKLEIDIEAKFAKFTDGLDKIQRDVDRGVGRMTKSFGALRSTLGGIGIGLGVGTFVHFIKGSIDAADHLQDLSKTTRISVDDLAGLALAAKQSGSDLDGIAASINKLMVNIGKEGDRFRKFGITAKEPVEAFAQAADKLMLISDQELRAAAAAELFGRSWATAAPLLAEGGAQIRNMVKRGSELTGPMGDITKKADEFNDKMAEMGVAIRASLLPPLREALPFLQKFAENITAASKAGSGFVFGAGILLSGKAMEDANKTLAETEKRLASFKVQLQEFENLSPFKRFFTGDDRAALKGAIAVAEAEIPILREKARLLKEQDALTSKPAPGKGASAKEIADANARAKAFVGGGEKGGRAGPIDRSAERLLQQQLKDFEHSIEEERSLAQTRNDFLQRFYDDGLISLSDYTKARGAIEDEALVKQKLAIGSEIALLEASKKGQKGDDRIATDTKINELLAKQADLNRDAKIAGANLFLDNIKAGKEFAEVLKRINIRSLESKGDIEGAARMRFSMDNEADLRSLDTTIKSATTSPEDRAAAEHTKRQIIAMQDQNIQIARFNVTARESNILRQDAADAEERIQLAIKAGTINELEGLQQIGTVRSELSTQLERNAQLMKDIAEVAKDPALVEWAKQAKIEVEKLNGSLTPLSETFEGMASRGIAGFFEQMASGTVSAKQAFKNMIGSITADLTRFFAEAAAKQLAAKLFSSVLGAGFGGGGTGGVAVQTSAGGYAEGGQVSGPGTNTSDSIPVLLSNKEFVVRAKPAQDTGALAFLTRFNKLGMKALPRLSTGGLVGAMASQGLAAAGGGVVNYSPHFVVEARTPKETQQQLASSAYQGGMRAYRRNR